MPSVRTLIAVFEDARQLLADPGNDFTWSSWIDAADALMELDSILATLRSGVVPGARSLAILFAPTGPMQAVSLSSSWGNEFLALSERFDAAMATDDCDG